MTELDLSSLPPSEDVPKSEFGKPDHTKSREGLRRPSRRPAAKKATGNRTAIPEDVPKGKPGQFVEPVEQIYTGLALTLMPFDAQCATVIMENGNRCALAWDDLAQRSDAVRKALIALSQTSAWGTMLIAHAPILLAVAGHHMPGRGTPEPPDNEPDDIPTEAVTYPFARAGAQ